MRPVLQLNEFFVEGKSQEKSHVLLHITEPSSPEEQEKGYFFALAEIENGDIEQVEHIQQMIDDLESGYYETEDEDDKNAFEISLEYINRRGHHILENEDSDLHCLVGTIVDGKICFAYHGDVTAFVFFDGPQGAENISAIDPNDKSEDDQLFSSMLQGEIHENDLFYVSTPGVNDYVSSDRIHKLLLSRPLRQAAGHLQKVLSGLDPERSFGGIFFHLMTKKHLPKTGKMPEYLKRGSEDSLNSLLSAQKQTANTLNPPILSKAGSSIGSMIKKSKNKVSINKRTPGSLDTGETNYRPRELGDKEPLYSVILIAIGKGVVITLKAIFIILQKIITLLKDLLISVFYIISNYKGKRSQVIEDLTQSFHNKKKWFSHLPLVSKILLISTLLFAIVFISSLFYLKAKEAKEVRLQAYLNTVQAVIDKKDAADASLIYGDQERAFTLLNEAKELITSLPDKTEEEKTKIQELNNELEETLMKIRKINTVAVEIFADLAGVNANALTTELERLGGQFIAYGPADDNFYLINSTGNISKKSVGVIDGLASANTPKEDDICLFISQSNTLAQLEKDTWILSGKDISYPNENPNITDLFVYSRRIYSLDAGNNQIYRHNPTQTGYDRGSVWIKQMDGSLQDAVSLAIDGDVFVLKSSGEIYKFVGGEQEEFTLKGLDPALENPISLWTYNDTNYIYILEPAGKRVVKIDKNGRIQNQYTANEWQNPTGMLVDEEAGYIYVLDDNKIYRFEIE